MGVTRTFVIENLDDIVELIVKEKNIYRKRFEDMVAHNENVKGAFSQKKISDAAATGMGLDLAADIVRDCKFRRDDVDG
jgi:hypothetical protein